MMMDTASAPQRKIIMTKTDIIPRNEREYTEYTKDINCSKGTYPQYAVSSRANETYIVCWKIIPIFGYCLEYNFGGNIVQSNNLADCRNYSLSPCKSPYSSVDSYMIFECFEKYGGVPSPNEQKKINTKKLESIKKQNDILQGSIDSKQSELQTAWVIFGISLGFNIAFISGKIIPLLRNWYTNKTGNGKTTRKEEKDQYEETKNEESDVKDNLLEQQNTSDFQVTSSAVQASGETVITVQEYMELAKEFHDMKAKTPIGQNFMNKAFDNLTPSQ